VKTIHRLNAVSYSYCLFVRLIKTKTVNEKTHRFRETKHKDTGNEEMCGCDKKMMLQLTLLTANIF